MRYSMLVYMTKMGRTLLEAVQYLQTAPEDGLKAELLENGRQMLAQIRTVLEQHREDLRSTLPLDRLNVIEDGWQAQGTELKTILRQFIQCLPEETVYQVRAVFYAELGEKWDAMESVYQYMREDPRFDPVVVRTPVGRVVQRDGKREQEVIYKDFLTPMGIPSLGYDQYDIEADCPELAFTSQPYENCTLEQFWPETIAKYTRLVYLPYFLPDKVSSASVSSLSQLPVYRFAWKVVCPNEKEYKFYCLHADNKGENALLTGIPKTDPLVRLTQHSVPRPKGWERLEGKRIILWNSWYDMNVSSLRFFDDLLEWFSKHEDCGLIWRPHPMTDTVTKLYYPAQYSAYQKKLQRLRMTKNVVLDKEVSCMAAFSASNAMISDYSSLLPQYLLLDKPALWIKSPAFQFTGEEFIDSRWMEQAEDIGDVFAFMERIQNGEDSNAGRRGLIRKRDIPLADGQCGERLCNELLMALHKENLEEYSYG